MSARSADRDEQYAAAAMRRLVGAHTSGEIPTATYRARRRQLLEALARGQLPPRQPLPRQIPPPRRVPGWLAGAVAIAIVVLLAALWWLTE